MKRRTFLGFLLPATYVFGRDLNEEVYKTMERIYGLVTDIWNKKSESEIPYYSLREDLDGNPENGFEDVFIMRNGDNFEIHVTDYTKPKKDSRIGYAKDTNSISFNTLDKTIKTKCREDYDLMKVLKNILKEIRERENIK